MTAQEAFLLLDAAGLSVWSDGVEPVFWPAELMTDDLHRRLAPCAVELHEFALAAEDIAQEVVLRAWEWSGRAHRLLRRTDDQSSSTE